jgi:hypothetical protein
MEPLEIKHDVVIKDVDNPMYPLLVECTCGFKCHCRIDVEADFRKRSHESASMWLKATKGWQYGH